MIASGLKLILTTSTEKLSFVPLFLRFRFASLWSFLDLLCENILLNRDGLSLFQYHSFLLSIFELLLAIHYSEMYVVSFQFVSLRFITLKFLFLSLWIEFNFFVPFTQSHNFRVTRISCFDIKFFAFNLQQMFFPNLLNSFCSMSTKPEKEENRNEACVNLLHRIKYELHNRNNKQNGKCVWYLIKHSEVCVFRSCSRCVQFSAAEHKKNTVNIFWLVARHTMNITKIGENCFESDLCGFILLFSTFWSHFF